MQSTPSPRASITPEEFEPHHTPPRQYSPIRSPIKPMSDIIFEEEEDNEDEENNSPNFPPGNCIQIPNANSYDEASIDNMNLDPVLRKRYVELSSSL